MASKEDKEYEDLRQFFTAQGWSDLSNYEKLRMQNMKRNYEMMIEIGKLATQYLTCAKMFV